MDTIFMNTKNSGEKESHVFESQLPGKMDLRTPPKHLSLSNHLFHMKKIKEYKNRTKNSRCLIVFIHYTIFIIIFNTSKKTMNKEKSYSPCK